MKVLADCLPVCTSLWCLFIAGKPCETIDAQLAETLVSHIIFTDRLVRLKLENINLTAKPAAAIARSLHQAPSLRYLNLSHNPLGEGISVLTRHLCCVPHLVALSLDDVTMTKQQVIDLSAALRQSNIPWLRTQYHGGKGNVKPEEEWPTGEYWREHRSYWYGSGEPDPGSVTDSGDEQEPRSYLEM